MFRAVRAAWNSAREKRLFGLFAFEFVVVVLGVLTAQGVQAWAQERERERHAEAERNRLEQGFLDAVKLAEVWRAALPCLRERVEDVMRAAGTGASVDAITARRPKLPTAAYEGATPDTYARIARHHGERKAGALEDLHRRQTNVESAALKVRAKWELFRLLDPEFGQISAADRAAARMAGASILAEMRSMEIALDMIEEQAPIITAEDATPFDPQFSILPVRSCAEIWANGTAYRKLAPGETPPI